MPNAEILPKMLISAVPFGNALFDPKPVSRLSKLETETPFCEQVLKVIFLK